MRVDNQYSHYTTIVWTPHSLDLERSVSQSMHATTTIKATVTDSGTTPAIVVPVHPSAVSQFV